MNIDRFSQSLERAFKNARPVLMHDEQMRRLCKPRPLAPLLDKTLEGEDEIDTYAGSFEAWPGNVEELLVQHELMRSLLTFNSDGFGPISWSAGLVAIKPDDSAAYLCKWDELESYQLLASVSSAGDSEALAQLVVDELARGSVVLQPPHHLWNDAPDLLDRAAIEDAFARLLDRTNGWGTLAEEHFGRIVEPNHLQRCLDLLEGLPQLDDEKAVSEWLESEDDTSDLSESARRLLLTEFLDRGYEESWA
jgi:hypothetical protein